MIINRSFAIPSSYSTSEIYTIEEEELRTLTYAIGLLNGRGQILLSNLLHRLKIKLRGGKLDDL